MLFGGGGGGLMRRLRTFHDKVHRLDIPPA